MRNHLQCSSLFSQMVVAELLTTVLHRRFPPDVPPAGLMRVLVL